MHLLQVRAPVTSHSFSDVTIALKVSFFFLEKNK
jgi:hypothetical protein